MVGYCPEQGHTAISCNGRKWSFDDFLREIERVAGALQKMGVRKGDSVGVCLLNSPAAIITVYAINRAGGIANIIHPKTNIHKLREILHGTRTRIVFASSLLLYSQIKAYEGMEVVACGIGSWALASILRGVKSFKLLRGEYKSVAIEGEDIAVYMHSGGTTGVPKTAKLSNRSLNALVINLFSSIPKSFSSADAMLAVLPIFHGFGFAIGIHAPLCQRMRVVPWMLFKAKKLAGKVKREKITVIPAIPRMLQKLLVTPNFGGAAVKTVTDVFCGGDALSERVKVEFEELLKKSGANARVCRGYGLTEMNSVCVLNVDDTPNSIGKPLKNTEVRVRDDEGNDVKLGNLWLSGEAMMSGYLEPDCKAIVIEDGKPWLNTGDIVETDAAGNLFFKGRAKRLIKISGMNVFPSEIESVANAMSFVDSSAAVERRVNDKPYIVLYITLKDKMLDAAGRVMSECKAQLSQWHVPTDVIVLEAMPMTKMGKIDINALTEQANKKYAD
jgi:long-chain acyl-CoA synthetase